MIIADWLNIRFSLTSHGSTAFTARSSTPLPRNTTAQENIRTREFDQNGKMTSKNKASRDRPLIIRASTKAQGKPSTTHQTVTQNASMTDFHSKVA